MKKRPTRGFGNIRVEERNGTEERRGKI